MDRIITQLRQISRDFNRTVAISERFIDFSSIGKYYEQAQFTLDTADIKTAKGQLLSYDDVFFDHIAMQVGDNIPVCAHVIKLSNHDEAHSTEYCHTLLTWLMNDSATSERTAEELFIHRNTLTNRLERINSIIDEDLDDFNIRGTPDTLALCHTTRSERQIVKPSDVLLMNTENGRSTTFRFR